MTGFMRRRFVVSAMVFACHACSWPLIGGCEKTAGKDRQIVCHVGGTMRPVMKQLAETYEKETGLKIVINSAGSGELLAHIAGHEEGDIYVCHDPFLAILMARGLGLDAWTVAELTPVIVVRKGNPKKIQGLVDATRRDVSLVLTDYRKSTLGRMLPTMFERAGIDIEGLKGQPNVQTFRKGGQAANVVKSGNADAAVVWNAVAHLRRDGLDVVPIGPEHLPIPGVDAITSATGNRYYLRPIRVTVATLKCSNQRESAKAFCEFVASKRASKVLGEFGFTMTSTMKEYEDGQRSTDPASRPWGGTQQ